MSSTLSLSHSSGSGCPVASEVAIAVPCCLLWLRWGRTAKDKRAALSEPSMHACTQAQSPLICTGASPGAGTTGWAESWLEDSYSAQA